MGARQRSPGYSMSFDGDPGCDLCPGADAELAEDAREVCLDRLLAEEELPAISRLVRPSVTSSAIWRSRVSARDAAGRLRREERRARRGCRVGAARERPRRAPLRRGVIGLLPAAVSSRIAASRSVGASARPRGAACRGQHRARHRPARRRPPRSARARRRREHYPRASATRDWARAAAARDPASSIFAARAGARAACASADPRSPSARSPRRAPGSSDRSSRARRRTARGAPGRGRLRRGRRVRRRAPCCAIVTRADSSSCAARAALSSAAASAGYRSPRSSRIQLRIQSTHWIAWSVPATRAACSASIRRLDGLADSSQEPERESRRRVEGNDGSAVSGASHAPYRAASDGSPSSTRSTASSPQGTATRSSPADASSSSVAGRCS